MAHAGGPAADSDILRLHEQLSFHLGPYEYELASSDGHTTYSVSDGTHKLSVPLNWAFGEGETGQTFVLEREGTYYEARPSYFPVLKGMDSSPGHPHSIPASLEEALGRKLDADETHRCFGCHTTASTTTGEFHPDHLIPGVTCEACHGPGAKHVAAMKQGRIQAGLAAILNPAKLRPIDSVDFCGACHRTWADVVEAGGEGVSTLRFHPYRLELSRCWGKKGDARLTCLACHDPHQPLVHVAASYDRACLRCHLASAGAPANDDHRGKACPQNTKNCATCHMPKLEVPDTHTRFTDHWIGSDRIKMPHMD
jgi:hypothetical protein